MLPQDATLSLSDDEAYPASPSVSETESQLTASFEIVQTQGNGGNTASNSPEKIQVTVPEQDVLNYVDGNLSVNTGVDTDDTKTGNFALSCFCIAVKTKKNTTKYNTLQHSFVMWSPFSLISL